MFYVDEKAIADGFTRVWIKRSYHIGTALIEGCGQIKSLNDFFGVLVSNEVSFKTKAAGYTMQIEAKKGWATDEDVNIIGVYDMVKQEIQITVSCLDYYHIGQKIDVTQTIKF